MKALWFAKSRPSGACRTERQLPPGLTSSSWIVFANPFGPHQRASRDGSRNASNTRSRGASKKRTLTMSRRGSASRSARGSVITSPLEEDRNAKNSTRPGEEPFYHPSDAPDHRLVVHARGRRVYEPSRSSYS